MNLMPITPDRKEIIDQFPIEDRDNHIYKSIDEAVEDALRRAFKDINFRTMTATQANKSIKSVLEQFNGKIKINKFDIGIVTDPIENAAIAELINRLNSGLVKYDDCKITEYLIVCLINNNFVKRFVDYFNCNAYKSEADFDEWHHDTAKLFLGVLNKYYDKAHYGKAQKIINMMFKHLYCMKFGKKDVWKVLCEEYFEHCHMPLDSFTLDWLNRKDGIAVCEWSNLEYTHSSAKISTCYNDYVNRVRKLFPINGLTVFQGEFYIWPQMQITQALETVYRMDHNKAAITTFVGSSVANKCSIMAFELGQRSFSKMFI